MKEYDAVEVLSDHIEWNLPIPRGAKGVIVDLPENSRGATVEFTLPEEIAVYTFDIRDVCVVHDYQPREVMSYLTEPDDV